MDQENQIEEQEVEEQEQSEPKENGDKQTRERSAVKFPYIDIDTAMELPLAISTNYGMKCSLDQLAAKTGHSGVRTGAFARKIAGAQTFNMVERDGEEVRLTEIGRLITNESTRPKAKAMAFLEVELYKMIYQEFKGGSLPNDMGIEHTMKTMGVAAKQAESARQVFRRSAEQSGFFAAGKDRLVAPAALTVATPSLQNEGGASLDGDSDTVMQLTMRLEALEKENERLKKEGAGFVLPNLPAAVTGVLTTLPLSPEDRWTSEDLTEWSQMFTTVIKRAFRDKIQDKPSIPQIRTT